MRFTLATAVAAACVGFAAADAVNASQVIAEIKALTNKTATLLPFAEQVTAQNAPAAIVHQGPLFTVLTGINDILLTLGKDVAELTLKGKPSFNGTDASDIATAFTNLTSTHANLANIFTLKSTFLKSAPIVGPGIASVFTQLDASLDTYAQKLLTAINGTSQGPIKNGLSNIEDGISKLAKAFSR